MRTPKLAECDQTSFFNALLTLSQLGLEPDGRRAHLIPFNNRKRGCVECQLIVDYKGLSELAMRSGMVSRLHSDVVCENDEFEYDCGELKRHRIDFRKPRGKPYAVYALVEYKDGAQKAEVMTLEDVAAIRARSRAGNDGPWVTDYNEMAKKTVFRRLSKWLPLSAEFRDAVDADEDVIEVTASSVSRQESRLVEVAGAFELPPQVETVRAEPAQSEDEAQESAAGLAPAREPDPADLTSTKADKPSNRPTPQFELGRLVTALTHNFGTFATWAQETANLTGNYQPTNYDEVSTEDAKRLVVAFRGARAKTIILPQLDEIVGRAK
jgi:recombination protein RecT